MGSTGITKKTKQTSAKSGVLPSRSTGLKQPPANLAEWIRLANLVPAETYLPDIVVFDRFDNGPSWAEVLERIFLLPPAVQNELITRSRRAPTADEDEIWGLKGLHPDSNKMWQVDQHYNKIRTAYLHLRMISQAESNSKSIDPLESLVRDLRYADLSYLRQCAYEKCGKIFYAGKSIQPGCVPEHSGAVRKRNKRERDKLNRQDPYIKKKRAKTAPKR